MGWRTGTLGVVLVVAAGWGQQAWALDHSWTLIAGGSLTTSSQLYYNPNAQDPVLRAQVLDLPGFFGLGAELKYQIPETHIAFGISAEQMRARSTSTLAGYLDQSIPVEDGFTVIPVELTGYFTIPISGDIVTIFMGGGAGLYLGGRSYSLGGTEAALVSRSPGFGIHVLTGVCYRFTDAVSVTGQMKFRDLQFESTNQFSVSRISYQGTEITVSREPFTSSVHTDGITFQLGLGISF